MTGEILQRISNILVLFSLICLVVAQNKQITRLKREVERQKRRAEKYIAIVRKEGIHVVEDDYESEIMEELSSRRYARNAIIASLTVLIGLILVVAIFYEDMKALPVFLIYWVVISVALAIRYFVIKSQEK